ncbi:MAG TPA: MarR family winged helix-turn-helix transcriptional regulator [Myxococcales bacterium]|nr:MarR family winged helix-turn-helix transcriptional regulator [Myxococcales bacterium]
MKRGDAQRIGALIATECLSVRVRRLGRIVTRIYDTALAPHGVSTAQMNLLAAVAVTGGARAADLGEILGLEKSTLSRDLKRMERLGWIRSRPAPTRGRNLVLTPAGSRLLVRLEDAWNEAQSALEQQLGRQHFARLRQTLPSPVKRDDVRHRVRR